jgi:hypothetical protein
VAIPNAMAASGLGEGINPVNNLPPIRSGAERNLSFSREGNNVRTPFATAVGGMKSQLSRASSTAGNTINDR